MAVKDNQIQVADLNQIQQIGDFGVNELMALKESIAKKLTVPQFNLFMYQMNRMGLDPSLGHGVPILYGQDVNIRIEYEGYHSLAQESEGYKGVYRQVVCENETEDFEAETDEEGVITKIKHKIRFPRGKVVGSYAIAKREGKRDVIVLCDKSEFEKYAKKNPQFWQLEDKSIDPDMAKKHAATRAVKEQYDIATTVEENMGALNAGDSSTNSEPQRKDITQEVTQAPKQAIKQPTKEPEKPIDITPEPTDEVRMKEAQAAIADRFKQLGVTKNKAAWITENVNVFDVANMTLDEYETAIKVMDMKIAEKQVLDDQPL